MILKFDDVIYEQIFTIEAKDKELDVIVKISDEESQEIGETILALMSGQAVDVADDAIEQILFKDQLPEIKELLIGLNYNKFIFAVMGDFANFISASLLEAKDIMTAQTTDA